MWGFLGGKGLGAKQVPSWSMAVPVCQAPPLCTGGLSASALAPHLMPAPGARLLRKVPACPAASDWGRLTMPALPAWSRGSLPSSHQASPLYGQDTKPPLATLQDLWALLVMPRNGPNTATPHCGQVGYTPNCNLFWEAPPPHKLLAVPQDESYRQCPWAEWTPAS